MLFDDAFMDQMAALLKEAEPCDLGCSIEKVEIMRKRCREINPHKPIAVVTSWQIWDIVVTAQEEDYLKSVLNLIPSKVYAEKMIEDEQGRGFGCVKTSFLQEMHEGCIYETKNTFYILVDSGKRKQLTLKQVNAVFF